MRKYYLDNIRWLTIVLVVIYHVIYMYNGVQPFGVIGPFQPIQYQDSLQYLLYPWFMVLLFAVSGMTSRFYLEAHSDREFIKNRTRKLLIPGTLGVLAFGWIQGYYNMLIGGAFDTMDLTAMPKLIRYFIMAVSGISVLWYVQILWVFSVLLIAIRKFEKDRFHAFCGRFAGGRLGIGILIVLVIPVYFAAQVLNTPVVTVYRLGIYGLVYFIGYFVLSHNASIDKLVVFRLPLAILAAVFGIVYTVFYFGQNYAVTPVINNVTACAYAWFMTLAVFALMKKHADREFAMTRWMAKRSWGLYVFHYLPLSMVAWYLHIYAAVLPPAMHYLLTALAAFAGGILLYEIISRIPALRWCILGIKKEKRNVQRQSDVSSKNE